MQNALYLRMLKTSKMCITALRFYLMGQNLPIPGLHYLCLPTLSGNITNARHAAPPSSNEAHNIRFLPALKQTKVG